jgi:hypothetical protein
MKIRLLALTLVMTTGVFTSSNGFAVDFPEGCDRLNQSDLDGLYSHLVPDVFFGMKAGETISISANTPTSSGTPTDIILSVDESQVDSDVFPGALSHQFLTDGLFEIQWTGSPGNSTWSVECELIDVVTPVIPVIPVPTLSWQGIAVLVTLLTGIAFYRRRKLVN